MNRSLLLSLLALSLVLVAGCDAEVEGDEPGECSDQTDNDQDGVADCDDDGCAADGACAGDDDDTAGDDDDSAGDDDDTAGDDDDTVGDDDSSAGDDDDTGDDDDSAGDDDDTAGDDDSAGDDDDTAGDDDTSCENFRIEMYWAIGGDDMDLHLLEANDGTGVAGIPRTDSDCHHNAPCWGDSFPGGLDWGVPGVTSDDPYLDGNDAGGIGPENINIPSPALSPYDGEYVVFVHDDHHSGIPASSYEPANDVGVNIYLNGVLTQSFSFQLVGEDDDYYVAKIHCPTGVITACNGVATSPTAGCP